MRHIAEIYAAAIHHKRSPAAPVPVTLNKRQNAACASGSWVTSPAAGALVDANNLVTVSWDVAANCIDGNPEQVVIALRPAVPLNINDTTIHNFIGNYGAGTLDAKFESSFFTGRANPAQFLFQIYPVGDLPFSGHGSAPFKATPPVIDIGGTDGSSGAASAAVPSTTNKTTVVNNLSRPTGLSKGAIAAAVIMPILAVGVAIGVYVFFSRKKEAKRRRRFSEAVDKRMSTISGDWKSISAAGAQAAIRASMAGGAERASAFFGNGRPQSTFGLETEEQQMGQLPRPRITAAGAAADGARVSRVSFAESAHTRQSKDGGEKFDRGSTYSRTSRAFPPVPPLPHHLKDTVRASAASEDTLDAINEKSGAYAYGMSQDSQDEIGNLEMSPTQTHGPRPFASPFVLGDEDNRGSIDVDLGRDVMGMPAMAMMRQSDDDHDAYGGHSQTLFSASPTTPTYGNQLPAITIPSPTLQTNSSYSMHPYSADAQMVSSPTQYTSSPYAGFSGPVASSTPDDLLRAYASRSATAPSSPVPGTSPDAMLKAYASRSGSGSKPGTPSAGGMRTLYAQPPPPPPPAATRQGSLPGSNNPYRETMVSRYSDDEDEEEDIAVGRGSGGGQGHVGHAA
jgi:hypothetical protein